MGTGFEFRVLGPLEALKDGGLVPIRSAKQRVLLASLLIDANQVVPVATLVARLWGTLRPVGPGTPCRTMYCGYDAYWDIPEKVVQC